MKNPVTAPTILSIDALDMEARGVGRLLDEEGQPGKVIFVEGALPGERVSYASYRRKPKFEQAHLVEIHRSSVMRTAPKCQCYGMCGGCSMQHIEPRAQLAFKQKILEDNLRHIGKVKPELILRPIAGPNWGYRYRGRFTVRYVAKKGTVLVGFHEKKSGFVADMRSCEILPPHLSALLVPLRELVSALSIRDRVPQIEFAVGHDATALVFRIMDALSADDEGVLRQFADKYKVQIWLQTKGPDTATLFYPEQQTLAYHLPEFGIVMPFKPVDFTQVNHQINQSLMRRAMQLLEVQPTDNVLDLFCGIGNFTLPLATLAQNVMGIEGSDALTARALDNAKFNGLDAKTSFSCRNLFTVNAEDIAQLGQFDRWLIDPPRDGAQAVCDAIAELARQGDVTHVLPKRIVYVSCSPGTLARDAGVLVNEAGYRLSAAGVVNMFPHTSHVESMAVFDRD